MTKIVFTGGGTAGHVVPNLAVIRELKKMRPKAQVFYLGSKNSLERKLVLAEGIKFHAVETGKLRRYFSLENFQDVVRVLIGIWQARIFLRKVRPDCVFAKGGFVAVPTALAAASLKIPLVIHESDACLGLATKICAYFAKKICVSFPLTKLQKLKAKFIFTGNPIRLPGVRQRGLQFLNFQNKRPIILVVGGSSGAQFLNEIIRQTYQQILTQANLVLITGGQNFPKIQEPHFRIFKFLTQPYLDVLSAADLVVSRAGANALFEIAQARKPSLLIPLPKSVSRGDQLVNAQYFAKQAAAKVLSQSNLTPQKFVNSLSKIFLDRTLLKKMSKQVVQFAPQNSAKRIAKILLTK